MSIPKKVKYLGEEYTIEIESRITTKSGVMGLIDYADQMVYINEDLSNQVQAETCLHEFLHLMDNKFDLEFEESHIKRLSGALYGFLRENPKFVTMLME